MFGSKDVSRQVAAHASRQTVLGADLLKQMLPVVAAMTMGVLSKQRPVSPSTRGPAAEEYSAPSDRSSAAARPRPRQVR